MYIIICEKFFLNWIIIDNCKNMIIFVFYIRENKKNTRSAGTVCRFVIDKKTRCFLRWYSFFFFFLTRRMSKAPAIFRGKAVCSELLIIFFFKFIIYN